MNNNLKNISFVVVPDPDVSMFCFSERSAFWVIRPFLCLVFCGDVTCFGHIEIILLSGVTVDSEASDSLIVNGQA